MLRKWKNFITSLVDFNIKTFIHQISMATKKITDENFEADVLKASKPTVVDFWAE